MHSRHEFSDRLDAAARELAALACFIADPQSRLGLVAMWSDFCRHGIRVSRLAVPGGVEFLPTDAASAALASDIPQFAEIGPSPMTARQIADELPMTGDIASRLDQLVVRGVVARAGDREAPTGIEPVYTALQAAA